MRRSPKLSGLTFDWLDFPEDVIVETSSFCNLRCVMCPHPTLKRPKGEMPLKVFTKIVDEVAKESPNSRLWVAILGEPLLGKNLVPMLRYARDKKIKHLNLNTNATFLTPEITTKLLDCGIENLHVSLDATTKNTYDQIRVGGDFDAVMKNVGHFLAEKKRLKLSHPNVICQIIVMDENEKEVEDFKTTWLSRGATVKVRLKMGWGTAVSSPDLRKAAVKRDFPCAWLLRSVSIQWDGRFAQCDADYEAIHSPGNINTQTIKEVWDHALASRRKKTLALDFSNAPCNSCLDWSVGRADIFHPQEKQLAHD